MNTIKTISRLSTSLRGKSCKSILFESPISKSTSPSQFSSLNRIASLSRLPVESSCLLSLLPLHSAIASARLQSVLSVDTHTWCLVPQGISMPL